MLIKIMKKSFNFTFKIFYREFRFMMRLMMIMTMVTALKAMMIVFLHFLYHHSLCMLEVKHFHYWPGQAVRAPGG
jgi:hypothetical protein